MALTKVGPKYQVTIPKAAREALGIKAGDLVDAQVQGRTVVLRPKIVLDNDPELVKQLQASEVAVREGRVLGPFTTAGAAMKAARAYARRAHRTVRR